MNVKFTRKVRKIGKERILAIPEEVKDIKVGERVQIEVSESAMTITKES